jgi:K+-transporting ATPase ATPase B chain
MYDVETLLRRAALVEPAPDQPPIFERAIVGAAVFEAFKKLDPRHMAKTPTMLVVELGSVITTTRFILAARAGDALPPWVLAVSLALGCTVFVANLAEAVAESRARAYAHTLRSAQQDLTAQRLLGAPEEALGLARSAVLRAMKLEATPSTSLRVGHIVYVATGEVIPADGAVIEGVATVDERALTGAPEPVQRASASDRSEVIGGTRVVSNWLLVRVTTNPGEAVVDRVISTLEGARSRRSPRARAASLVLAALTIAFVVATFTIVPVARGAAARSASTTAPRASDAGRETMDQRAVAQPRAPRRGSVTDGKRA